MTISNHRRMPEFSEKHKMADIIELEAAVRERVGKGACGFSPS